jgi:hypothetical protein
MKSLDRFLSNSDMVRDRVSSQKAADYAAERWLGGPHQGGAVGLGTGTGGPVRVEGNCCTVRLLMT